MVYVADVFMSSDATVLHGTRKVVVEPSGNRKVYWKRWDAKAFNYEGKARADETIKLSKMQIRGH